MATYNVTVQHKGELSGWTAESAKTQFTVEAPDVAIFWATYNGLLKADPDTGEQLDINNGASLGSSSDIIYGPNGYVYTAAGRNETVIKWDPADLSSPLIEDDLNNSSNKSGLSWGLDNYLYVASDYNALSKVDPATLDLIAENTTVNVNKVLYGNNDYLYAAGWDNPLKKIDPGTMDVLATSTNLIRGIAKKTLWLQSGNIIVTTDDRVDIYAPDTLSQLYSLNTGANGVCMGGDGYLYVALQDGNTYKMDQQLAEIAQLTGVSGDLFWGEDGFVYCGSGNENKKIDPDTMEVAETTQYGDSASKRAGTWTFTRGEKAGMSFTYP